MTTFSPSSRSSCPLVRSNPPLPGWIPSPKKLSDRGSPRFGPVVLIMRSTAGTARAARALCEQRGRTEACGVANHCRDAVTSIHFGGVGFPCKSPSGSINSKQGGSDGLYCCWLANNNASKHLSFIMELCYISTVFRYKNPSSLLATAYGRHVKALLGSLNLSKDQSAATSSTTQKKKSPDIHYEY